ncbi:MAG TPA: ABC transporter substrate-binding protein, partial [Verrucomicrobiae bacterium]|nr:ABC transporter substrate-binding protein [Verrucomicrobiae bacterium]
MRLGLLHFLTGMLLLLALFPSNGLAQEVVVVQSLRVRPYEDAVEGFRTSSGTAIHKTLIVEETPDVAARVRAMKPDLVFAVGGEALRRLADLADVPVVYAMVLNPRKIVADAPNVTGISMNIPA